MCEGGQLDALAVQQDGLNVPRRVGVERLIEPPRRSYYRRPGGGQRDDVDESAHRLSVCMHLSEHTSTSLKITDGLLAETHAYHTCMHRACAVTGAA